MKKKLLAMLGRICKFIATGTVSLFLAACYGPPVIFKKIFVQSPDLDPVPEIKVSLFRGGIEISTDIRTDAAGEAVVPTEGFEDEYLTLDDTDGALNGGEFASQSVPLSAERDYVITLNRK